ncbi:MAG: hypothetical protein ABI623_11815, partial [bacterium]
MILQTTKQLDEGVVEHFLSLWLPDKNKKPSTGYTGRVGNQTLHVRLVEVHFIAMNRIKIEISAAREMENILLRFADLADPKPQRCETRS